jgi:urease accessory protein
VRDDAALATDLRTLDDRLERCHGVAELRFIRDGSGVTRVARLFQRTPCRVLFPRSEPGEPLGVVLLTTSGGLTGGDRLDIAVEAGDGVCVTATTQAAEKIYRATGRDACIDVAITAMPGSWLEWLPQETILFDGARLVRRTRVEVTPGARFLGCELAVFGRSARGERFLRGRLHDAWRVSRGGRLVWADALHLDGDVGAALAHPAGFDGAGACATVIYAADEAGEQLGNARGLLETAVSRCGVTVVNGILLARFLAREAAEVRADVMAYCAGLRAVVAGLPRRLPRVWLT